MDSPRTRTPHAPISADQLPVGRALLREQPALRTQFDMGLVRFIVVDSNRLARDCARNQVGRTHLRELIDSGSLVVFVPERVLHEVPRALAEGFAPRSSLPLADMLERWKELNGLLTIVPDCELAIMAEHQGHDQLNSRDRDDVDFIVLAQALGAKVFTADRDLLDLYPEETIADLAHLAELKHAGRAIAVGQVMPLSGLTSGVMIGRAGLALARPAVSAMRGPLGWVALAAVAAAAIAVLFSESAREKARQAAGACRRVGNAAFDMLEDAAQLIAASRESARARASTIDHAFGPPPTVAQAAYGLLLAGADGGHDALLRRVQEVVGDTSPQELRKALAEHSRLCETASGYRLVLDGSR